MERGDSRPCNKPILNAGGVSYKLPIKLYLLQAGHWVTQGAQSGMLSHTLSTGITHSVKSLTQTNMYSESQTLQAFTKLGGYRDYVASGLALNQCMKLASQFAGF